MFYFAGGDILYRIIAEGEEASSVELSPGIMAELNVQGEVKCPPVVPETTPGTTKPPYEEIACTHARTALSGDRSTSARFMRARALRCTKRAGRVASSLPLRHPTLGLSF
jgi:hypothetical protein